MNECGELLEDQMGYLCDVCGGVIETGTEIWIESYRDDVDKVPAHPGCRHHTCYGMIDSQ